jgi:hypothetical protein
MDRSRDLVSLTAQAWFDETKGTVVSEFIGAYQRINIEVMKAEEEARVAWEAEPRNKGKTSKAPRMTKHFKDSDAAAKLRRLLAVWIPRLNVESPWAFTASDPLPSLYDESLRLSKRYAKLRAGLPNSISTEFGFDIEWEGFNLVGFIDNIEPIVSDDDHGELLGYGIIDYKTYRQEPSPQKDWRQGVVYDIAIEQLAWDGYLGLKPGLPRYVIFDYPRLEIRRDYLYGPADRSKFLDELKMYELGVTNGVFLPASKHTNPDFCDYGPTCCMNTRGEGCGVRGGLYDEESDE